MLHVQFLVRFLIFGTYEANYYGFTIRYGYDRNIAWQSLLFTLACMICFTIGYKLFNRRSTARCMDRLTKANISFFRRELYIFYIIGFIHVAVGAWLVVSTRASYSLIVAYKEDHPFLFQIKIVFLLILSHLLLNIPLKQFLQRPELSLARRLLIAYGIVVLLSQARSEAFEFGGVFLFTQLMWNRDRVKCKYLIFMFGALIVPNIIVLGRLGFPSDPRELLRGLFSFEYSVYINDLLSQAILQGPTFSKGLSFLPSLTLLIPSPVRTLLGIEVVKSYAYVLISELAGVSGGGFSMLAEMYTNFGWYGTIVIAALGAMLGRINSRAANVGNVTIFSSIAPQFYLAFILTFRNDLGVFIKLTIQLALLALTIDIFRRLTLYRKSYNKFRHHETLFIESHPACVNREIPTNE